MFNVIVYKILYSNWRERKDLKKHFGLNWYVVDSLMICVPTFGVWGNAIWYQPLWREPAGGLLWRFGSSEDRNVSKKNIINIKNVKYLYDSDFNVR